MPIQVVGYSLPVAFVNLCRVPLAYRVIFVGACALAFSVVAFVCLLPLLLYKCC